MIVQQNLNNVYYLNEKFIFLQLSLFLVIFVKKSYDNV